MRIAVAVGGTDKGISGIGVYVRQVLPRLSTLAGSARASLVLLGTEKDLDAYPISGTDRSVIAERWAPPLPNALWHLTAAGEAAQREGADVLLLPAANRRMTLSSPIPTIAVVHDLAQARVAAKYDALRMAYVNGVLSRALRSATALAAVSSATRTVMVEEGIAPADRIHVIPNGVDLGVYRPERPSEGRAERAKEQAGIRGPYVFYASRLEHPGKNHARLLRAFAGSRARATHTLVLAGKDWGAEASLREEARALGIADRVLFLGFVPDELLPGLLAGADAAAAVGLHEGFGLPAIEALASGRPIIAADAGALPEVVGSLGVLCDPLDERSIAWAIDRALFEDSVRDRTRREGPAWAARFSWEATANALFQLATSITERRRAPGELLPRARAIDVLRGRAPLVGTRLQESAPRGLISPIESRIAMGIPYCDLAAEEAHLLARRSAASDAGVVVRSIVAAALAPKASAIPARSPRIVSARVDNVTIDEALDRIFEPKAAQGDGRARRVHFVHPHALNLAAFDEGLASTFASADLVLPDGVGIRIAASILGVSMRHNVNGTDLLPLLCRRAAAEGVAIALIGAAPGVAEACASRLTEATPGLSIALVSHGFLDETTSLDLAQRLRTAGRVIALVGMGSPLQERWSQRYLADLPEATVLTVGGLFDFYSGRMPRAPQAVRELGLEWLFRLAQEPRRLARRYVLGNPLFLLLALRQRLDPSAPAV